MKALELLQNLVESSDRDIEIFVMGLEEGFKAGWDCDVGYGIKNFGSKEIRIAAKYSIRIQKTVEINRSWD